MKNEPAFPQQLSESLNHYCVHCEKWSKNTATGMTLRDWFAGKAMQAYIAKIPLHDAEGNLGIKTTREDIANSSYWQADAMLREREKEWGVG